MVESKQSHSMPAKGRVLIIDDYSTFGQWVGRHLARHGYESSVALTGSAGLDLAEQVRPDIILLDIHMAKPDGIMVYRALRETAATRTTPIILMTAHEVLDSLLEAAVESLGAEPVQRKSEGMISLVNRVLETLEAGERPKPAVVRGSRVATEDILRRGPLSLDMVSRKVWCRDRRLGTLAARPAAMLNALMRSPGAVDRMDLLETVWPGKSDGNLVNVTIKRLRASLKGCPKMRIATTRSGYELFCDC